MIVDQNRRSMPTGQMARIDYVCVLVEGENNDVAAYLGAGAPEEVARYGDKVSLAEACIHFPGLDLSLVEEGKTYRQ